MRKRQIVGFLVLLTLAVALATFAQEREVEPVAFHKISDKLYEVTGGSGARGGVYIGETGVLLIDSKMDETSVSDVLDGVRNLTDKPILYLVNTHSDGDHVQGNRYIPTSVIIVAHENCREEFFHTRWDGSPSDWTDPALADFVPEITFSDRMTLHLGADQVEIHHFGVGHTTGDAVIYFPEEKAAFVGDQIFFDRPQLIHAYKGGDPFGHVKNLKLMLKTLDAEQFFSGHGDVTDRDGIRAHADAMTDRIVHVQTLTEKGAALEEIRQGFPEDEHELVEIIHKAVTERM